MISTLFALTLASAAAQQTQDATATARNAFTACLRTQMDRSVSDRTDADGFETAMRERCAQQEAAYRAAVIEREVRMGGNRNRAEQDAEMEVDDAKENFRQLFADAVTPA
jgi:hypothetical protein